MLLHLKELRGLRQVALSGPYFPHLKNGSAYFPDGRGGKCQCLSLWSTETFLGGSSAQRTMLGGLRDKLKVWQVHEWDGGQASPLSEPSLASQPWLLLTFGDLQLLRCGLHWNRQAALEGGGVQEGGPSRFPHAGMATTCRTHGGLLLATPAVHPALLPAGPSNIQSGDGGLWPGKGKQPLRASR